MFEEYSEVIRENLRLKDRLEDLEKENTYWEDLAFERLVLIKDLRNSLTRMGLTPEPGDLREEIARLRDQLETEKRVRRKADAELVKLKNLVGLDPAKWVPDELPAAGGSDTDDLREQFARVLVDKIGQGRSEMDPKRWYFEAEHLVAVVAPEQARLREEIADRQRGICDLAALAAKQRALLAKAVVLPVDWPAPAAGGSDDGLRDRIAAAIEEVDNRRSWAWRPTYEQMADAALSVVASELACLRITPKEK